MARLKEMILFWREKGHEFPFPLLFQRFQDVLKKNNEILEIIAGMGDKLGGSYVFDKQYVISVCEQLNDLVHKLIHDLNVLSSQKYTELYEAAERVWEQIQADITGNTAAFNPDGGYVLFYDAITRDDLQDVGGKNANVAELKNVLQFHTPDGFAITTRAFHDFMLQNNLAERAKLISGGGKTDPASFERLSQELRREILEADIPPLLERDIRHAIGKFRARSDQENLCFAVRSSATEEDTAHSFAGQYKSFLNVPENKLLAHYKKVLASAYSVSTWQYRLDRGFQEYEISMAVGCQLMLEPKCSGILYTMDPAFPEKDVMMVTGTWGLAVPVVEGTAQADRYVLSRDKPHAVQEMNIAHKDRMLVSDRPGGTRTVAVPEAQQDVSCLNRDELEELARIGLAIEGYYKRPQDIEWACDRDGRLTILQTRALQVQFSHDMDACSVSELTKKHPVAFSGKGDIVQRGIAYGKVFVIQQGEDFDRIPKGAIVVAKNTSPQLTKAARIGHGIITDIGSPTGHMATVAREFRIPTIVNTEIATSTLRTGEEITLDASHNMVYRGIIKDLCYYERSQVEVFEESYEYRLLHRVLDKVSHLNLVNPRDEGFKPGNCRTFHDIVRFVHEKAVNELMHVSEKYGRKLRTGLRPLKIEVPLGLFVLDIGDGVVRDASHANKLTAESIMSTPMKAFLIGLIDSGFWATEPVPVDLRSMMSSITRTFSTSMASPNQIGRNLAVISKEYMNLSLRLGYHFNIIDAYIGDNINDNYVYFRFTGGVTDIVRRSRRTAFIAKILQKNHFMVETLGDLVIGRLKKRHKDQMRYKIALLGALVSYTRQLDLLMHDEEQINHCVEEFIHNWPVTD